MFKILVAEISLYSITLFYLRCTIVFSSRIYVLQQFMLLCILMLRSWVVVEQACAWERLLGGSFYD